MIDEINGTPFDEKLMAMLQVIAREGITNAARGFSGLLGVQLNVQNPGAHLVALKDIPNLLGGPENEAIGIYLRAEGGLAGQIMLIIPYQKALELVDLMMENPSGTTTTFGSLERSALAEVGNQAGTFFLNTLAAITGKDIRPTPPAVMVDMIGAILDIIIATMGGISEHVLLLQANLENGEREVETNFWVIPDPETLRIIQAGV